MLASGKIVIFYVLLLFLLVLTDVGNLKILLFVLFMILCTSATHTHIRTLNTHSYKYFTHYTYSHFVQQTTTSYYSCLLQVKVIFCNKMFTEQAKVLRDYLFKSTLFYLTSGYG